MLVWIIAESRNVFAKRMTGSSNEKLLGLMNIHLFKGEKSIAISVISKFKCFVYIISSPGEKAISLKNMKGKMNIDIQTGANTSH